MGSMIRRIAFLLLAAALPAEAGEDGLRLPASSSATVTQGRSEATVSWPFGSVVIPDDAMAPAENVGHPAEGPLRAETRGRFRLSYTLVREGNAVAARSVRVRVHNTETYHSRETDRLREHERTHRRINEAAARRMERVLSGVRWEGVSMEEAEILLKKDFDQQVDGVRALHAEWDETHVFISTGPPSP